MDPHHVVTDPEADPDSTNHPDAIRMRIWIRLITQHCHSSPYLHVLADELKDPLLDHGVGHVDSEEDAGGARGLRVPANHISQSDRIFLEINI